MIREIYTILPTDKNFKILLETHDEITLILELIRMVLGTKPGEVLGSPDFGINLDLYIFNLSFNKEEMVTLVLEAIINNISYNSKKYSVSININFGKDKSSSADYALIDISINENKCLGVIITQ